VYDPPSGTGLVTDIEEPGLKRSLGLLAVVALGINGIIGQGIFFTPGFAADVLGPASILALVCGGVISALIALCFAEVGSRFHSTGGAYVYTREAFGDFVGFEVGWLTCCVAVISYAGLATGFTAALGQFVPALELQTAAEGADAAALAEVAKHNAAAFWPRAGVMLLLFAGLTAINLVGAKQGAAVSTFFTFAKLVPLALFIVVGAFHIDPALFSPFLTEAAPDAAQTGFFDRLASTTLILLYAYVGFETLVVPAGEMRDPQKNVPRALLIVMGVVTAVYVAVLVVAVGTFPGLAGHENPVAAASELVMGPVGGTIVALGICVSVFGTNAAAALVAPRRFFALAERGDLPPFLARVNPNTGVPYWAVLASAGLSLALALTGSFRELIALAVMARFLQYIPTCLAALILREREVPGSEPDAFRLPGGPVLPLLAIALCAWLMWNTTPDALRKGTLAVTLGLPLYWWAVRKRGEGTGPAVGDGGIAPSSVGPTAEPAGP